jgi:hypothetical protein
MRWCIPVNLGLELGLGPGWDSALQNQRLVSGSGREHTLVWELFLLIRSCLDAPYQPLSICVGTWIEEDASKQALTVIPNWEGSGFSYAIIIAKTMIWSLQNLLFNY